LPADLVAPDETGLDVFLEPLRVQQVGATPTGPAPKTAPVCEPQASDDGGDVRASILEAYRELVTECAKRLVRKETTAPRKFSKKFPEVKEFEREVKKFYSEFAEADADYTRESKRQLSSWLAAGDDIETLLVRWEHERAVQIVEREMAKWRDRT
jgi:hypothetical protein